MTKYSLSTQIVMSRDLVTTLHYVRLWNSRKTIDFSKSDNSLKMCQIYVHDFLWIGFVWVCCYCYTTLIGEGFILLTRGYGFIGGGT